MTPRTWRIIRNTSLVAAAPFVFLFFATLLWLWPPEGPTISRTEGEMPFGVGGMADGMDAASDEIGHGLWLLGTGAGVGVSLLVAWWTHSRMVRGAPPASA